MPYFNEALTASEQMREEAKLLAMPPVPVAFHHPHVNTPMMEALEYIVSTNAKGERQ